MGLVLDSSVVIAEERRGRTVRQILEQLQAISGQMELSLSVVTVVELFHGIQRAQDEQRRRRRQAFVDELVRDIWVHPVTTDVAMLAGIIEGELATQGARVPFEDLLIAATALHFGSAVATLNVRHFRLIPGLEIVALG